MYQTPPLHLIGLNNLMNNHYGIHLSHLFLYYFCDGSDGPYCVGFDYYFCMIVFDLNFCWQGISVKAYSM